MCIIKVVTSKLDFRVYKLYGSGAIQEGNSKGKVNLQRAAHYLSERGR